MRIRFELLALFRHKAGTGHLELEVVPAGGQGGNHNGEAGGLDALDALRRLEEHLGPGTLGALEGDRLRRGVLLFARSPGEPMRRIVEPVKEPLHAGQTLVLATAMEGG